MNDRPATADHARMMRLVDQLSPETRVRLAQRLDDRFHEITGTPRADEAEDTSHITDSVIDDWAEGRR
ncbi:hypothetical protein [Streptomyces sp. NPDC088733]|uniref:hypothetical protein n=1 Tax=Streptomyces sp. NPDC088733 TaxID=3365880 RepID=UPI0038149188